LVGQDHLAARSRTYAAWVCRDSYPDRSIEIAAVRFAGERQVFHAYAIWDGWAFDHSGWNPEPQLLAVHTDFEGHPLERVKITVSLAEFCEKYDHRMANRYWHDPLPRAREYVGRYIPPWA
jgi:hypothetical protein